EIWLYSIHECPHFQLIRSIAQRPYAILSPARESHSITLTPQRGFREWLFPRSRILKELWLFMADSFALVVGDKRFSSWSLRPWLLLKEFGIPFREERVALRQPGTGAEIAKHGLGTTVPILKAGEVVVWDSLAIAEYLAERFADKPMWPRDA